MNETNLVLREATPDDCEDILIWRNDPISLKMFKNSFKMFGFRQLGLNVVPIE